MPNFDSADTKTMQKVLGASKLHKSWPYQREYYDGYMSWGCNYHQHDRCSSFLAGGLPCQCPCHKKG